MLLIVYECAQTAQCPLLILGLVTRLGTFYEYLLGLAGVRVTPHIAQTHPRLHLIDILTSGTSGTECVPLYLTLVDLHIERLSLREHSYRSSRGVDSALGLGSGNSLNTMYTALIFHCAVHIVAGHTYNNLFIATCGTLTATCHSHIPAL